MWEKTDRDVFWWKKVWMRRRTILHYDAASGHLGISLPVLGDDCDGVRFESSACNSKAKKYERPIGIVEIVYFVVVRVPIENQRKQESEVLYVLTELKHMHTAADHKNTCGYVKRSAVAYER